ncbi:SRPBCC family protein [Roseibacillus ishigakijimensis]|uniref:SRPBCC family protein n=1 Tax=Roseibacillus ishigakijimensis TaxID=454146 RepID=A0A934RVE2_9BACT|nr:SRPBCC family protein [Roseibacillus ishigakijimensis]MBK1834870.1 SRPBCC family protein [Roseibacillus ishigakijimensis]
MAARAPERAFSASLEANPASLSLLPLITLTTRIKAPIKRVFDLSRSIDLHLQHSSQQGELAICNRTSGLIGEGEAVTWKGTFLGFRQSFTLRITEMESPHHFTDEMVKGPLLRMKHLHHFEEEKGRTLLTDEFDFQSRGGFTGWLLENSFLTAYFRRGLAERSEVIKRVAESEDWKKFLPADTASD